MAATDHEWNGHPYGRLEWMGRPGRVEFKPHWPVGIGNYTYDGFDSQGIWVTHADGHQRHIIWYDIETVELR
jgi:hypothetical protein